MPRYHFPPKNTAPPGTPLASKKQLPPIDQYQSILEKDFPHILESIQTMWGYRELNMYFRKLMLDDRGKRNGFPPEAWEEIHSLLHLHQEIMPESLSF